jgi:hypothetical protein
MALASGQGNNFSRRQLALKSYFLSSDKLKLQIQRGRKIGNLMVRLTLRYNFLPLVKMENGLGAYEEMIDDSEKSFVPSPKCDLLDIQREIFKIIAHPSYPSSTS